MKTVRQPAPALAVAIWLGLLALLGLSLGSAYLPLGPFNLVINLAASVGMALLMLVFFMHLRRETALVRLAAAIGFIWLMFLFGLSLTDYLWRTQVSVPW